jgi:hypothetical protein
LVQSFNLISGIPVIAQKSMKWVQMQKKRYGEKRRGGYVDMGKQVCQLAHFLLF